MLNSVEILFIFLAVSVGLTGEIIHRFRECIPNFILQSYLYGSFGYRGKKSAVIKRFELPKSYFKHFYVFASILTSVALYYMWFAYRENKVPPFVSLSLSTVLRQEKPQVCAVAAACSLSLLSLQIYRRTYETQILQVFAADSKINVSHYIAGFIHYLGCIITLLGQAISWTDKRQVVFIDMYTKLVIIPCVVVFMLMWYEQYKTNEILSSLRRDARSGAVVTERHGLPRGRWFRLVSSPHRLTELLMYTALFILCPTRTFFCIYSWVLLNQIQTAILAHEWYFITFKNYPKQRTAIFPHIL